MVQDKCTIRWLRGEILHGYMSLGHPNFLADSSVPEGQLEKQMSKRVSCIPVGVLSRYCCLREAHGGHGTAITWLWGGDLLEVSNYWFFSHKCMCPRRIHGFFLAPSHGAPCFLTWDILEMLLSWYPCGRAPISVQQFATETLPRTQRGLLGFLSVVWADG